MHYVFMYFCHCVPATGGPTVRGMAHNPRMNPMPCDAPAGPQISYAIGPNIVIKQPSNSPMIREKIIMAGYAKPPKCTATVKSIVHKPIDMKDICCKNILFTLGWSATFPKMIRPNPDVAAIHVTKTSPPFSGMIFFRVSTYATMWT